MQIPCISLMDKRVYRTKKVKNKKNIYLQPRLLNIIICDLVINSRSILKM